jgi:hypothetical protein
MILLVTLMRHTKMFLITPSYRMQHSTRSYLGIPRLRSQVVTLFMFNIIKYFIPLTKSNQPPATTMAALILPGGMDSDGRTATITPLHGM